LDNWHTSTNNISVRLKKKKTKQVRINEFQFENSEIKVLSDGARLGDFLQCKKKK